MRVVISQIQPSGLRVNLLGVSIYFEFVLKGILQHLHMFISKYIRDFVRISQYCSTAVLAIVQKKKLTPSQYSGSGVHP